MTSWRKDSVRLIIKVVGRTAADPDATNEMILDQLCDDIKESITHRELWDDRPTVTFKKVRIKPAPGPNRWTGARRQRLVTAILSDSQLDQDDKAKILTAIGDLPLGSELPHDLSDIEADGQTSVEVIAVALDYYDIEENDD